MSNKNDIGKLEVPLLKMESRAKNFKPPAGSLTETISTFTPSALSAVTSRNLSSEDQVSAFVHMRLRDEYKYDIEARKSLNSWLNGILGEAQKWRPGAWKGRVLLKPSDGSEGQDYIVVFRFATYELLGGWLNSKQRRSWIRKLSELGVTDLIGTDIQEGTVAFMPPSMTEAAWRSLSSRNDIQDGEKHNAVGIKARGQPAKWKSFIVIWLGLQCTVIPFTITAGAAMNTAGIPFVWSLILTLSTLVPVLNCFLLPILDRLFAPFLHGNDCCPKYEPFLTLQVGFICCRPSARAASEAEKKVEQVTDRVRTLETNAQKLRRGQSIARRRLLERVELLETKSLGQSKIADGASNTGSSVHSKVHSALADEEFGTKEEKTFLEDQTASLLASNAIASASVREAEEKSDSPSNFVTTDEAVTVFVSYKIRPECVLQFEEWVFEIARTAATRTKGHRGAVVVEAPKPGSGAKASALGQTLTHIIIFQYDSKEHLNEWVQNPLRKRLVARLKPMVQDESQTKVAVVVHDSFADIIGSPKGGKQHSPPEDNADNNEDKRPLRHAPQKWKISLVIGVALFFVIYWIGGPIVGPFVDSWGMDATATLYIGTMVSTAVNVVCLTWVLLPLFVIACRSWLFYPWREHKYFPCRFCQRGFSCFDTVGQSLKRQQSK